MPDDRKSAWTVATKLVFTAGWAPISVVLLHVFLFRVLNAYELIPPLDIPMHFFGGVAMAFFLSRCFGAVTGGVIAPQAKPIAEFVFVVSLTATAAVFWEFAEFGSDVLFAIGSQRGLRDTLLDMALGILGGVSFALIRLWRAARGVAKPGTPREYRPEGRR